MIIKKLFKFSYFFIKKNICGNKSSSVIQIIGKRLKLKMMHQRQLKKSPSIYGSKLDNNIEQSNESSIILSNISTSTSSRSSKSTLFIPSLSLNRLSSSSLLLSVLAWSVTFCLLSSCIGFADAGVFYGHALGKRSFTQLQCKGVYDRSIFARLDRICEDCYNLFREPQLHTLCRKNCFTTDYFKGCLDVLLLHDEMEKIQTWIKQLHGAEPSV